MGRPVPAGPGCGRPARLSSSRPAETGLSLRGHAAPRPPRGKTPRRSPDHRLEPIIAGYGYGCLAAPGRSRSGYHEGGHMSTLRLTGVAALVAIVGVLAFASAGIA